MNKELLWLILVILIIAVLCSCSLLLWSASTQNGGSELRYST